MLDSERLVREDRLEGRNPVAKRCVPDGRFTNCGSRGAGQPDPALARWLPGRGRAVRRLLRQIVPFSTA